MSDLFHDDDADVAHGDVGRRQLRRELPLQHLGLAQLARLIGT